MRILVTGANGFIGAHLAARLATSGHQIVATARDVDKARVRYPDYDWIKADFRAPVDWRLDGVDAVINCVGVLQDGGPDSTRAAHVEGAIMLFKACEAAQVRRVIHISAIGADPKAGTAYARTKAEGDHDLMGRNLDWIIVKPSLVIARGVHGGTALVRGLAGMPLITPLIQSEARFYPIHMTDLCTVVEKLLAADAPVRLMIQAAGPQPATLQELVAAHRRWLGFGPSHTWVLPPWLTTLAFGFGDLLGYFGVRTALRSTSRAQMAYDVSGDPGDLPRRLGFTARPYTEVLQAEPASVQDRWHARLYFAKPAAVILLAVFWIVTGIVCLTTGREEAMTLARRAGFSGLEAAITTLGGVFDILIGTALLMFAKWRRLILLLMALVTVLYVMILTWTLPQLWSDPLGRLAKLIPFFALLALLAATHDER